MDEWLTLLEKEIPAGRQALLDSHHNLQKVASYCDHRYVEDDNKKAALEETKNYTTQSLASVAYQINALASNMLHMLDLQDAQIASMDSAINNISQIVDIHKEKVARREIGLLTTNKEMKIELPFVKPTNHEKSVKYIRKPVDYSELDNVGHGVKVSTQPMTGNIRRTSANTTISRSPITSTDGSVTRRDSGQSSTGSHGTLRAVKAPTVPQDYNMNGQQRLSALFHHRTNSNSSSESGSHGIPVNIPAPPPPMAPAAMPPAPMPPAPMPYATGPDVAAQRSTKRHAPAPPHPPVMPILPDTNGGYNTPHFASAHPHAAYGGGRNVETYATTSVLNLPPTPQPSLPHSTAGHTHVNGDHGGIPPPPMSGMNVMLPPPPPPPDAVSLVSSVGESNASGYAMEPDWVPKNYLEKMVVIYDYIANNPDELNLTEDQIVYVVKKNDDGWFEGVLDGVTGLFPGNYAESAS